MTFDPWQAAIGAGLGIAAAAVFLALLWWTVWHLPKARRPGLWLGFGTALRIGLVVGALYLLHDGYWERLAGALAGFVATRSLILRLAVSERFAPNPGSTEP